MDKIYAQTDKQCNHRDRNAKEEQKSARDKKH